MHYYIICIKSLIKIIKMKTKGSDFLFIFFNRFFFPVIKTNFFFVSYYNNKFYYYYYITKHDILIERYYIFL
jgi:hypothetical protein